MANLYELLMARERGNIQDAPNKQRIGQVPMNLRSAMRYAEGGSTEGPAAAIARIQAMLDENKRNSAAQMARAQLMDAAGPAIYKEDESQKAENLKDNPVKNPTRPIEPTMPEDPIIDVMPEDPSIDMDAIRRAQQLAEMEKRRQEEEYYFKMRNSQPPPLPLEDPRYGTDPGFTPMPIEAAYPPNYLDPKPTPPTNDGYPFAPLPENYPGAPTNLQPPSSGLLGQLGPMFQSAGIGQAQGTGGAGLGASLGASLGAGLPGKTKPAAGMGQSLDSLINYLSTPRKP